MDYTGMAINFLMFYTGGAFHHYALDALSGDAQDPNDWPGWVYSLLWPAVLIAGASNGK